MKKTILEARVHNLFNYIARETMSPGILETELKSHTIWDALSSPEEKKKEYRYMSLRYNKNTKKFQIMVSTWEESYHNGDIYSESNRLVEIFDDHVIALGLGEQVWGESVDTEKFMCWIEVDLNKRALKKAAEELQKAERDDRFERITSYMEDRIKNPYTDSRKYINSKLPNFLED